MPAPVAKMIPLPHVGRCLAAMTGEPSPSARIIYDHALKGAFPATFKSGRWFVREGDLSVIADVLGLTVQQHDQAAA